MWDILAELAFKLTSFAGTSVSGAGFRKNKVLSYAWFSSGLLFIVGAYGPHEDQGQVPKVMYYSGTALLFVGLAAFVIRNRRALPSTEQEESFAKSLDEIVDRDHQLREQAKNDKTGDETKTSKRQAK